MSLIRPDPRTTTQTPTTNANDFNEDDLLQCEEEYLEYEKLLVQLRIEQLEITRRQAGVRRDRLRAKGSSASTPTSPTTIGSTATSGSSASDITWNHAQTQEEVLPSPTQVTRPNNHGPDEVNVWRASRSASKNNLVQSTTVGTGNEDSGTLKQKQVKITTSFNAESENELAVSAGEVLNLIHEEEGLALLSSTTKGRQGWVPVSHLIILPPRPKRDTCDSPTSAGKFSDTQKLPKHASDTNNHNQQSDAFRPLSKDTMCCQENTPNEYSIWRKPGHVGPADTRLSMNGSKPTSMGTRTKARPKPLLSPISKYSTSQQNKGLPKLPHEYNASISPKQQIHDPPRLRKGSKGSDKEEPSQASKSPSQASRVSSCSTSVASELAPDTNITPVISRDGTKKDTAVWNAVVREVPAYVGEGRYTDSRSSLQIQLAEQIQHDLSQAGRHFEYPQSVPDAQLEPDQALVTAAINRLEGVNVEDVHMTKRNHSVWSRLRKGLFNSKAPSPTLGSRLSKTNNDEISENSDPDVCQCGSKNSPDDEMYFCWQCDGRLFCDACWSSWPLHCKPPKSLTPTVGLSHEKCNPVVARKIIGTLHEHSTIEEQALLHLKDSDTSWFGTGRDEDTGDTIFQDFGRYADLMSINSETQRSSRYPGLVSFVGQTGAGKSSLVRLLVELHAPNGSDPKVPVVGSSHLADLPTSGDVHLYADLNTFETTKPLLFADCEGLDGGEREPMGAKSKAKGRATGPATCRTYSLNKHIRKQYHTADRAILWANDAVKRSREYHVRHLYPRLLYTFSDVIVFVMKNPRVIESVIEQLIKWAAAALEKSSNQPVLPHAIIVLNAYDNAADPSLWDVDFSTIDLLQKVGRVVRQHHGIRNYAEFWKQREKHIDSIEVLLLSYYSSIRVVRVPERGRPKLIEEQIHKLYEEIKIACENSRKSKHSVRMLLNSDELQPYLQYAFDHFCRNLDRPFDFVQASFANNPIASNFGGNILKLAIDIMDLWKDRLDAPHIFKELSFMVASCIMLDSARHRTLGPAELVCQAYLHHCDSAVQQFCDKHWPCEYKQMHIKGRCVNVKAGHTKGHQLKSGRVIAVGPYESEMSSAELTNFFQVSVLFNLTSLLEKLNQATAGKPHQELQAAARLHQTEAMNPFYQHLQGPKDFVSHTACYSCLMTPPEHALPCGHVICTPCAQMFGQMRGNCHVELTECPIHHEEFQTRWPLFIKPQGAGIRLLSLDGGGIRGIIELTILQQIQHNLGPRLAVQAFFDLIIGTSTGGIIALGLGAYGWSINKCITNFESLCKQAFTKRKDYGLPGLSYLLSSWHHSRYETSPIENALRQVFGSRRHLFAGSRNDIEDSVLKRMTKVGVTTATTAGTAFLLANYNRTDDLESAPYQFHRAEKACNEIRSWEAARATSAAPTYFKPFEHKPSGQVYADGALRYNCPIEVAYREQKLIWPDRAEFCPDIVLSLGTGYNYNAPKLTRQNARRPGAGFISSVKFFKSTLLNVVYATLNSEQTWRDFNTRSNWPINLRERYIRLNLRLEDGPPELDMVDDLPTLKTKTEQQFPPNGHQIVDVTNRLLATAFYFMLDTDAIVSIQNSTKHHVVTGTIECRFSPGSTEIRALGDLLKKRQKVAYNENYHQHQPYFVVQERRKESEARQILLTTEKIDGMSNNGVFSMEKISIEVNDNRAEHEILFCFADQPSLVKLYPISGFPRCFMDEIAKARHTKITDEIKVVDAAKFATVWDSLIKRDSQFGFDAADFLKSKDPFKLFSSSTYTNPGGASHAVLQTLSERFNRSVSAATTPASSPIGRTSPTDGPNESESELPNYVPSVPEKKHIAELCSERYPYELPDNDDSVPLLSSPQAREVFFRQEWQQRNAAKETMASNRYRSPARELDQSSRNIFTRPSCHGEWI